MHDSVRQALERLQRADSQLQQHDKDRPAEPTAADAIAAGDDELVDLARTLDTAPSEVDPDLVSEEEAARQDLGALQASVRIANLILVAAGAAAAAGIALLASVSSVAGVVLLAAAAVLIGFGLYRRRGGRLDATMRRNADLQAALSTVPGQGTRPCPQVVPPGRVPGGLVRRRTGPAGRRAPVGPPRQRRESHPGAALGLSR